MSKKIEITNEIQSRIRLSTGDESIDTSTFAVFEAKIVSTEAINQSSTLFHGSKLARTLLSEMANYVNSEGNAVPLLIMHDTRKLPVGKVFYAEVHDMENGESELRGMFYIPEDEDDKDKLKYINDIQNSVVDEVSVGLGAEKLLCSECGFDYNGEDSDFMNILTMTCNEGHTIGVDGVHIRAVGLKNWYELSLVGKGAARKAKISSKGNQKLVQQKGLDTQALSKLAASGLDGLDRDYLNYLTIYCNMYDNEESLNNNSGDETMNDLALMLSETNQKLGKKEVELDNAKAKCTLLETQLAEIKDKYSKAEELIAELKNEDDVLKLKQDLEELTSKYSSIEDFIKQDLKAAFVASGEEEKEVPEDIVAMLSVIKEKGLKLHQLFASGAKSKDDKSDLEDDLSVITKQRRNANFKLN